MAGRGRDAGRSVTSRVLAVLGAFDDGHPRLGLSEIARRSGMPVSTVSRLLAELVAGEALARRPDGRYEVGRRLWQLGLLAPVNQELREVALPIIHDVVAVTGDVVHIAVREGIAALYVERVSGQNAVAVISKMGSRLPLHATGVGKVLLAEAPPEVLEEALANLTPVTPYTITDPARLLRDLAETRRRGYARATQEVTLGLVSLAVPIRSHPGPPVAALGLVTSATRPKSSQLVPALRVAAAAIGRALHRAGAAPA
jgi:DNA-binding IclR family transcriptional regulator